MPQLVKSADASNHCDIGGVNVLTCTVQEEMTALVGNLMRQLECLLHEYLSFNWDHADAMLRCNQGALQCAAYLPCHCAHSPVGQSKLAAHMARGLCFHPAFSAACRAERLQLSLPVQ